MNILGIEPVACITIPGLKTVSEANSHTHWRVRQRRAKEQRTTVFVHLSCRAGRVPPPLPVVVTLTRLSARQLDSDNLAGAMKHVRDGVADWFGVDDGDPRYEWRVEQVKSKAVGVRIKIAAATASPAAVAYAPCTLSDEGAGVLAQVMDPQSPVGKSNRKAAATAAERTR